MSVARHWLFLLLTGALCASTTGRAGEHPGLLLTRSGVEVVRANLGSAPLFDASLQKTKEEVDREIDLGIDVPVPRDFSGGYTHERHKRNFFIAQKAGLLFQILDEPRYGYYVRDMLLQYAALYPTLSLHPKERSYARGRLFWQCLNDANWLLYMAQAYDAIYDLLTPDEHELLETRLFRPFADFLSLENPQFYNRIHNHSAWGSAAVGMIGIVMGDDVLVDRALYGFGHGQLVDARASAGGDAQENPREDIEDGAKDDDGGLIFSPGQGRGFLANLDAPFSPDGYYTEGPYYQRYAMYPFLAFAIAMQNVYPDRGVLRYKDEVLIKAVYALLNLADSQGEFFAINDAQKGMSIANSSLVAAVDAAFFYGSKDPELLSIAQEQGGVSLDQSGMAVALGVKAGESEPFRGGSIILRDGPKGDQGGVAVLRDADSALELVFKFSAHGLSHGHFDKLAIAIHDDGREVLQDYGLVRFVNIEPKGGGNYLPENSTWAKQTVAHNTLVVDSRSQYNGDYTASSVHHSELVFSDIGSSTIQLVSARDTNAYGDVAVQRTLALVRAPAGEPVVIDVLRVFSDEVHRYDLPFHYVGQVIDAGFTFAAGHAQRVLGADNGYQHLWLEGLGRPKNDSLYFTWLDNGRFNTLTSAAIRGDELLLTRLGANDPEFNLRRDPSLIIRRTADNATVFASTIQSHGRYSPVTEAATNADGDVENVRVLAANDGYTAVGIRWRSGSESLLMFANNGSSTEQWHRIEINRVPYEWVGPYNWVDTP
ncbi:MAG: alginate lyase family protein [Pseudomonadota bacterium]